jgi:hypothetical protein
VTHRRLLRLAQARRRLLHLRRASGCLGSSHGSSRGPSLTTSPPPHVRVPRYVARLVIDYFDYATRLVASARRATRRAARRSARHRLFLLAQACRRLLHLRRASGCFGTSRGLSCDSSSTTLPTPRVRVPRLVVGLVTRPVVDYFDCATRPGASARRAARRAARRRLRRLRRTSGCFGTLCGTSRVSSLRSSSTTSPRAGSLLTTSPTPHVRLHRHVARLVS